MPFSATDAGGRARRSFLPSSSARRDVPSLTSGIKQKGGEQMGIIRKRREKVAEEAAREAAENEDRYLLYRFHGGQSTGGLKMGQSGKVGGGVTQVIEAIEDQGYGLRQFFGEAGHLYFLFRRRDEMEATIQPNDPNPL